LIVENDTGGPDPNDPFNRVRARNETIADDRVVVNHVAEPHIHYMQAGQGHSVTQIKHETGGDSFESFQDRMIRSFVAGMNWSYSLTWKPTGQGTAERGEILRARKAVEDRQKMLTAWILRVVTYAYSFENAAGRLPDLQDPFAWNFTKPPRLSVDDGREHKMLVEGFRLGKDNMSDILEYEGRTFDEHLNKRAEEAVKRKLKRIEMFEKHGVLIDERELVMFTNSDGKDEPLTNALSDPDNPDLQ